MFLLVLAPGMYKASSCRTRRTLANCTRQTCQADLSQYASGRTTGSSQMFLMRNDPVRAFRRPQLLKAPSLDGRSHARIERKSMSGKLDNNEFVQRCKRLQDREFLHLGFQAEEPRRCVGAPIALCLPPRTRQLRPIRYSTNLVFLWLKAHTSIHPADKTPESNVEQ